MSKSRSGAAGDLNEIQALVDLLAHELGRAVAVDNASFEFICASAQIGVIDGRRISAIIDRAPPPEPVPWMLRYGIEEATAPVRLPANPEMDMLARVCFPIRRHHDLLGYLWLFDDPSVSEAEIEQTLRVVHEISSVLAGEEDKPPDIARAIRQHAADVLAGSDGATERASDAGYLPEDGTLTVHIVRIADEAPQPDTPDAGSPSRRLQVELSRKRTGRPFLATDNPDVVTVVERSRSGGESRATGDDVVRAATVAGVNIRSMGFAPVDPSTAFELGVARARFAADLASLLDRGTNSLAWDDTGAWRLLMGWGLTSATVRAISDDAHLLLSAGTQVHWKTVLAYLDNARNTTRTSQELFIHRATLHYRLARVREILGKDALDDGWRATAAHVALRLHAALARSGQEV